MEEEDRKTWVQVACLSDVFLLEEGVQGHFASASLTCCACSRMYIDDLQQ